MTNAIATAVATATAHTTDATSISGRALLVWLTLRAWSARKYDRKVSADVNAQYAAHADAGRYNKFLLPGDCASYKQLTALITNIRAEHYAHTLAWSDEGWRALTTANYTRYMDWLRTRQADVRTALDAFLLDYPRMRDNARQSLGKLYRDDDYPSVQDLRSRFECTIQVAPMPTAGDVRVDLASEHVDAIRASVVSHVEAATKTAMADAWSRLQDVVSKMRDKLATPDAIFRDSLVSNVREIAESLGRLNLTGDQQLEDMRARAIRELTMVDPDVLRDTPRMRKDVAAKADAILSAMSSILS